jgi:hypothetical protein
VSGAVAYGRRLVSTGGTTQLEAIGNNVIRAIAGTSE